MRTGLWEQHFKERLHSDVKSRIEALKGFPTLPMYRICNEVTPRSIYHHYQTFLFSVAVYFSLLHLILNYFDDGHFILALMNNCSRI